MVSIILIKIKQIQKSLDAEISHHLVVLVLEDVAVPHIPGSAHVEGEGFAIVVTELHSGDCYLLAWHQYHVQELLLFFEGRLFTIWYLVGPDINLLWYATHSSCFKLAIFILPILFVFFNIECKPADHLEIDKMNMYWMVIHGKIDNVEIINPTILERRTFAAHPDRHSINHHPRKFIPTILDIGENGKIRFPCSEARVRNIRNVDISIILLSEKIYY